MIFVNYRLKGRRSELWCGARSVAGVVRLVLLVDGDVSGIARDHAGIMYSAVMMVIDVVAAFVERSGRVQSHVFIMYMAATATISFLVLLNPSCRVDT